MNLKDLAVDHDYYCSETNYFSNECSLQYDTVEEFLDHWGDADIDMNLAFRWDVYEQDNGEYYAIVFFMLQRKGIFKSATIQSITEDDVESFVNFLKPHHEKLQNIWRPF